MTETLILPPTVPAQLGYAMPAEWTPHAATWIAWPHNQADWPGKFAPIPWVFAEIVRHLAAGERVHVLVKPSRDRRNERAAGDILARAGVDMGRVRLHGVATDRAWMRDSGPVFLTRSRALGARGKKAAAESQAAPLALVDFKFNAWAKYDNSAHDDAVPAAVGAMLGGRVPRFVAYGENDHGEFQRLVLEGGSVDVNGAGSVLTTEECLLSKVQRRNPGFARARIERALGDFLGVSQVLWLARGIAGDDTHGHIDDTARFVDRHTIVACTETNRRDANYAAMRENLRRLAKMRDRRGRQFDIVELPLPAPVHFDRQRLPASYANFYIANAGVLVPVFNDPADARALKVLEQCFRDRPVIPVCCRDLVWGLGTIHCLTQQQPVEMTNDE